jgi:hypothetical protein
MDRVLGGEKRKEHQLDVLMRSENYRSEDERSYGHANVHSQLHALIFSVNSYFLAEKYLQGLFREWRW